MLNNDFQVLVQKYARYQTQKKNAFYLKVLLALAALFLVYFLLTRDYGTKIVPVETNIAKIVEHNNSEENITNVTITPEDTSMNERSFQVTTEEQSLEQLTKNQEKSHSYSATIALANYHFSKKEYEDAIKWAIEASKKNKAKSRAWIVYAKSKTALGKEAIAIKALTLFLEKHTSPEAKSVLDSLQNP